MKSTKPAFFVILLAIFFVAFHRPQPENFTDSSVDRVVMYFIELLLRFTYVYPTRFCPNAYCQLMWTRFTLEKLLNIVGHWTLYDPEMEISDIELDSVPSRVYMPYNRSNDGAIVFMHGGGFVIGNVNVYESMVRQLARNSGMVTFSVDYRLAPEHTFPAGLDDCERAVMYIMKKAYKDYGVNTERISLIGDSAGGGLVASLTYRLRHRNDIPQIKSQVLLYPLLQVHDFKTPSYDYYYREMRDTAFVDPRLVAQYYIMYAGIDDQTNARITPFALENRHISSDDRKKFDEHFDIRKLPEEFRSNYNASLWNQRHDEETSTLLSPLLQNPEFVPMMQSDLSNLPPALVITMEFDVLRDEGAVYAKRLSQAGISTTWKHFPTGFHAMLNFVDTVETARTVLTSIAEWTRDNI